MKAKSRDIGHGRAGLTGITGRESGWSANVRGSARRAGWHGCQDVIISKSKKVWEECLVTGRRCVTKPTELPGAPRKASPARELCPRRARTEVPGCPVPAAMLAAHREGGEDGRTGTWLKAATLQPLYPILGSFLQ